MKQNHKNQGITPLKSTLLSCRVMLKFALLFGALLNLLMLATPLYSMQVLDKVISSSNTNTLVMLSLVIGFAILMQHLIQAGRSFALNKMGAWFEYKLSESVFKNSIMMSVKSKANIGSQKIRDLQTVKSFLISPYILAIIDTPWSIIFTIVLFMLHHYMGFLAIAGSIILVIMAFITDRTTKQMLEKNIELSIKSNKHVEQVTKNAEVIEVMGLMRNVAHSWQKTNRQVHSTQEVVRNRQIILEELTKFIRTILQISVTGVGAYLVINGELTSGAIIASSTLIGRAMAPFDHFIGAWKNFINFKKAFSRLEKGFELMEEREAKMSLPAPIGEMRAENVYYAPHGAQAHTLKAITFGLSPGEMLVIIGPSASGKTTLAKLFVGALTPNVGTIRIDGSSINDWNRDELGPYIGYLPQDVELFSGTIRENIGRMDPNADPEKVVEAAQIAGVHDMILRLANGYDTEIGVDGSVLSGGQRQRIALARAFYNDPKVMVLDEPNSSLDSVGEEALITAIEIAKERKITVIVISHRNQILSIADKIMILKDGSIIKFGSKDEILNQMQVGNQTTAVSAVRSV